MAGIYANLRQGVHALKRNYEKSKALLRYKMGNPITVRDFPHLIIGKDSTFRCLDGVKRRIVDFDYTATKPIIYPVVDALNSTYGWRQNAHRAPSPKSLVTTANYEQAREIVKKFVGAEQPAYEVAFQANTTHALNTLSLLLKQFCSGSDRDLVLISTMSHHSNMLPFRKLWDTQYIEVKENGTIDMQQYLRLLEADGDRVALVTTELVSNVTGFINPVREMARLAHRHGALISVDNAQGAASLPFKMFTGIEGESIDFMALSGHKIYGPEGTGALIGKKIFLQGEAPLPGGGTVKGVTRDTVYYAPFPFNAEAGSQNHAGQIGMAVAMEVLMQVGLENIQREELEKARYAMEQMTKNPGIQVLGENDFSRVNRLGVIAFNLFDRKGKPVPAALVGAILAFQFAIGIRTGCFCAGPYMQNLLHLSTDEAEDFAKMVHVKEDKDVPYYCRASFSVDKSFEDIDYLINALVSIQDNVQEWKSWYAFDDNEGLYKPIGMKIDPLKVFNALERFKLR